MIIQGKTTKITKIPRTKDTLNREYKNPIQEIQIEQGDNRVVVTHRQIKTMGDLIREDG